MEKTPLTIDLDAAAELVGGDKSLALDIIADFKREIPGYLNTLTHDMAQGDNGKVIATIHSIGGGASYAGATQIRELAKHIEHIHQEQNVLNEADYQTFITMLNSMLNIDISKLA